LQAEDLYRCRRQMELQGAAAGGDHTEATSLNTAMVEVMAWSAGAGIGDRPRLIKIEEGTQSQNEQIAAICKVAEGTIKRDGTELDLLKLDRKAMVAALVAAGVLSQADSDSLYSLATQAISRATEIGLSNVRAGTVEQARALAPSPQQGAI